MKSKQRESRYVQHTNQDKCIVQDAATTASASSMKHVPIVQLRHLGPAAQHMLLCCRSSVM
jgi:hypothetical protein